MNSKLLSWFIYRLSIRLPQVIKLKFKNLFYSPTNELNKQYIQQILSIPKVNESIDCVAITQELYTRENDDAKLLAYYLPQFYPFEDNDNWWGKGTTEWNNVSKAVPQYVGHYQPRLPGELGYYDLRLIENIKRQVELAKMYGIYGFCYYYYWFDPKRLLDKPLDTFVNDESLDFPFCLCWANESWAKRFWGTDNAVIMEQPNSIDSYQRAIHDMVKYFKSKKYIKVNGACMLVIYKPSNIPSPKKVLEYWRNYVMSYGITLHIVGVKEFVFNLDLIELGFDAISEFQPGSVMKKADVVTLNVSHIRNDFSGTILSYKTLVNNIENQVSNLVHTYQAVMPMWDNTARKNNNKSLILDGSSPKLYKEWLVNVMQTTKKNSTLADKFIFINAWNEWGEGAYLEPDRRYGYAYLNATKCAIEELRLCKR